MNYLIDIIVAGGGGAAISYLMIKAFGSRILNHQFEKMIENYKLKLNLEFDRVAKLNQKEFEILPILWEKIVMIRNNILFFADTKTSVFFDLNKLNQASFLEFISEIPIPQHLKDVVINSEDKNKAYKEVIEVNGIETMKNMFLDFDKVYKLNKIFLASMLQKEIGDIHEYYFEAIGNFMNIRNNPDLKNAFRMDFDSKSLEKTNIISELIKKRLRFKDEEI